MNRADPALVDTLLTTLGNAYAPYSNHPRGGGDGVPRRSAVCG